MDCRQVRDHILEGREGFWVRRHLKHCADCAAYREQVTRAEALLQTTLPFQAPEDLTERLLAMVPQAAQELRIRAAADARPAEPRPAQSRPVLNVLLILALPVALSLGLYFWKQGLAFILPWVEGAWELLPLIPDAVRYWGGRLLSPLLPIRDALLFILSVLLVGLSVEQMLRRAPARAQARVQQ
jgi:hypothetical protein